MLTIGQLLEDEGYDVDVTTNPIDVTEEVCDAQLDCVEAVQTDEADYYRFESREQAVEYGESLEDGFVVHYIVMDLSDRDDSVTLHQRWAMERLAGAWQDFEGEIPR